MDTTQMKDVWQRAKPHVIKTLKTLYFPSDNPRRSRRWLINIGKIAGHVVFLFLVLTTLVWAGAFGRLPTEAELLKISNSNASEVYTADGRLMGRFYRQNRLSIDSCDISKHVVNALIATEDSRFFEHNGIDITGLGRVLFRTVLMLDLKQGGGSTISQQLAKNLFPRKSLGPLTYPVAKIKEIIIASRLEKAYSKEDILTLYLNTVPFGENVYGIEAASQRFFSRKAKWLDPPTAATLVGMLAANTAYNPRLNPDRSIARRNTVLERMATMGFIDTTELRTYKAKPLGLKYQRIDRSSGLGPFFRDAVGLQAKAILDYAYGEDAYDIYTDGLVITTTINSRLQKWAESAVANHLHTVQTTFDKQWKGREPWGKNKAIYTNAYKSSERYRTLREAGLPADSIDAVMQRPVEMTIFTAKGQEAVSMSPADSVRKAVTVINAGFLAVDPNNGDILAWVGGINHRLSQTDHVGMRRQVGSTFKPIVYAAALESGLDPAMYIENVRRTYADYDNWSPANSDNDYGGFYTLKGALTKSLNTISAWVTHEIGAERVIDVARRMGIESDIPAVPSIALGTAEISLYEMVRAYQPFANGGTLHNLTMITTIKDSDGKILYSAPKPETDQAITEQTAVYVNDMMQAVVDSGTARSLRRVYKLQCPLAGKTGTTQNGADGWFIGLTPNIVAGAWVGSDHPAIRFRSGYYGQGAYMALPIVGRFLDNASRYLPQYTCGEFPPPVDEDMAVVMHYPPFSPTQPDPGMAYDEALDSYIGIDSIDRRFREAERKRPMRNFFRLMKSIFGGKDKEEMSEGEEL